VLLTAGAFIAARHYLVISPNRWTRDHGVYVSWLLATLLIATVLENETLPHGSATTHYAAVPQLLLLLGLNAWIWKRQEPWLVALGAAASAATIVVTVVLALATDLVGAAYVATAPVLTALLVLLWLKAVSTKSEFLHADTIYIASKETLDARRGAAEAVARSAAVGRVDRGQRRARRRNSLLRGRRARADSGHRGRRWLAAVARRDGRREPPCRPPPIGWYEKPGCLSSRGSCGSRGWSAASLSRMGTT